MEENKEKKLSYEELQKLAGELHQNYQRLMTEYRKAIETLNQREFEYNAFFLDKLFKVIENADRFEPYFVTWCSKNIQESISSFYEAMTKGAEDENKNEGKEPEQNEA